MGGCCLDPDVSLSATARSSLDFQPTCSLRLLPKPAVFQAAVLCLAFFVCGPLLVIIVAALLPMLSVYALCL